MKKLLLSVVLTCFFCVSTAPASEAQDAESVAMNNEAVKFLQDKNFARAEERLISALKRNMSYSNARANLGIAFNNHGLDKAKKHDPLTAIRLFHQAYLVDPGNKVTQGNISGMLKMLDLDPKNASDHMKLGDYFYFKGEYLSALSEYLLAESMGNEAARPAIIDSYNRCEANSAFVNIITESNAKLRTLLRMAKDGSLKAAAPEGTKSDTDEIGQKIFTASVLSAVSPAWRAVFPQAEKKGLKKSKVVIHVTIENQVDVKAVKLVQSSGSPLLDDAALGATKSTSLKGLPPVDGVPNPATIALTFDYSPTERKSQASDAKSH